MESEFDVENAQVLRLELEIEKNAMYEKSLNKSLLSLLIHLRGPIFEDPPGRWQMTGAR